MLLTGIYIKRFCRSHDVTFDEFEYCITDPAEVTNFSVGPEYPLEDKKIKVICRVGGNPRPSIRIEGNKTDIGHEEYTASLHGPNSTLIGTSNFPTRRCGQFTIITCHGENWLKTWTGTEMLHTAYRRQTVFTACKFLFKIKSIIMTSSAKNCLIDKP